MFSWILGIIVGNLPTWFWPVLAGAGATVYFFAGVIGNFPQFKIYTTFIKPVGIAVAFASVFMWGGSGVSEFYQEQIKALEAKVALAEQQSADANTALAQKSEQQVQVIHDVQIVVKERIKEVEKKIDAECKVDDEAISILNSSAKNQKLGGSK